MIEENSKQINIIDVLYRINPETFKTEIISSIGYDFGTYEFSSYEEAKQFASQIMKPTYHKRLSHLGVIREAPEGDKEWEEIIEFCDFLNEQIDTFNKSFFGKWIKFKIACKNKLKVLLYPPIIKVLNKAARFMDRFCDD